MRLTPVEAAAIFAVGASSLAVIVPSCLRTVQLSRTAEATENLERLSLSIAGLQPGTALSAAPLTPSAVPRGAPQADPTGTWEHPTWRALGFALTEPHWYAYRLDVDEHGARLIAQGDLDGDGVPSTFTRTLSRGGRGYSASPALLVDGDLE